MYGLAMEKEANDRGIKANQKNEFIAKIKKYTSEGKNSDYPAWWGFEPMHASHRSNLTRKDSEHYGQYFNDKADKPYIWIRDNKLQFGSYRSKITLEQARKMQEQDIWAEIVGKKL